MDQLPNFSREITGSFMPTFNAFAPLLEEQRGEIEAIRKETVQYGEKSRQNLDLYFPPDSKPADKHKVLMFAYGGGFKNGSKTLPLQPLAYGNLGAFFAKRGLLVAVTDYRLIPEARYPSGGEDITQAVKWAIENIGKYGGDSNHISLLGNSAGGVHVAHAILRPDFFDQISRSLRIVCFISVLFSDIPLSDFPTVLSDYYGSAEEASRSCPQKLLKEASATHVGELPHLVNILGTLEPEGDFSTKVPQDFVNLARERGINVTEITAGGHNHLSTVLALSTGQGEVWAEELVKLINREVPK